MQVMFANANTAFLQDLPLYEVLCLEQISTSFNTACGNNFKTPPLFIYHSICLEPSPEPHTIINILAFVTSNQTIQKHKKNQLTQLMVLLTLIHITQQQMETASRGINHMVIYNKQMTSPYAYRIMIVDRE